jgi:hypothetical protein
MARLRLGVFGCDGVVQQLLAGLVALPVILGGLNGLIVILLLFSLWHASVALGPRLVRIVETTGLEPAVPRVDRLSTSRDRRSGG